MSNKVEMNRRTFLAGMAAAGFAATTPIRAAAPASTVAVGRCRDYGDFLASAARMFDQIGGLGFVSGKTVAIKINMTGGPTTRFDNRPAGRTHWSHPRTVGAVIHLLEQAGARRIRVLEGAMSWPDSLEEFMLKAAWDPRPLLGAARRVEFVNTNLPYRGHKPYTRFTPPNGGHLFPSYDLNTAYDECDVFVSMAKVKEHAIAGVTLSMKNCFGITPCTIYGNRVPEDEPSPIPYAGRQEIVHNGARQPPKYAVAERNPASPREPGYRVPRCVADLVASRPVHLAVLEGIQTITGAELPRANSRFCEPGFLVASRNCVNADAVGMALMGFDPAADRGTAPFERADSTLRLAEEHGVGTRDLSRIEVVGTPIAEARFRFRDIKDRP
jgi:uncharacterized protein (DUF362 family)